MYLYIIVLNCH